VARTIGAQRRHYTMRVIGGREIEAGTLSVRLHHSDPQGAKPKGDVVAEILANIKDATGLEPV
jgi:threonyl-tRNA synthetase